MIETVAGTTDAVDNGAIASGSLIEVASGSTLTLSGGAIGSAAVVETLTGGTLKTTGTVSNGGTLFASGGAVDISGVVNGGVALVGNGIVDILGASSENVAFTSGGSGGLELGSAKTYTGTVSGFGENTSQFIDFTGIKSGSTVTLAYFNSTTSGGTLEVESGTHHTVVGSAHLSGTYTLADFMLGSGAGGTVEITDPPAAAHPVNPVAVISGGMVLDVGGTDLTNVAFGSGGGTLELNPGAAFTGTVAGFGAHDAIDIRGLAFGARTTLAYAENASATGGTLTVTHRGHSVQLALLGNYMAASFVVRPTVTAVQSSPSARRSAAQFATARNTG